MTLASSWTLWWEGTLVEEFEADEVEALVEPVEIFVDTHLRRRLGPTHPSIVLSLASEWIFDDDGHGAECRFGLSTDPDDEVTESFMESTYTLKRVRQRPPEESLGVT